MACDYCTPIVDDDGNSLDACRALYHIDKKCDNATVVVARLCRDSSSGQLDWMITLSDNQGGRRVMCASAPSTPFCPSCGRALPREPKWLWRLESTRPDHGLWYDADGSWVWDLGRLGCTTKDLPMGFDWRYKRDGRDWFSSCSDKESLLHWYSEDDAAKLQEEGFVMARYQATEYVEYELETTFIKETCLAREEVSLDGLWGKQ